MRWKIQSKPTDRMTGACLMKNDSFVRRNYCCPVATWPRPQTHMNEEKGKEEKKNNSSSENQNVTFRGKTFTAFDRKSFLCFNYLLISKLVGRCVGMGWATTLGSYTDKTNLINFAYRSKGWIFFVVVVFLVGKCIPRVWWFFGLLLEKGRCVCLCFGRPINFVCVWILIMRTCSSKSMVWLIIFENVEWIGFCVPFYTNNEFAHKNTSQTILATWERLLWYFSHRSHLKNLVSVTNRCTHPHLHCSTRELARFSSTSL